MKKYSQKIVYKIEKACFDDLPKILYLQKSAFISQAEIYSDYSIPPLHQTIEEIREEFSCHIFLKVEIDNEIVGSLRYEIVEGSCFVAKVVVHHLFQNRGIGRALLVHVEKRNRKIKRFELFTGSKSISNLHLYTKLGYEKFKTKRVNDTYHLVFLEKDLAKSKKKVEADFFVD